MKYSTLEQDAHAALSLGVKQIVDNHLPSIWDTEGFGWHEQWMNADYSGVYAGCEGIILLSQAKSLLSNDEYSRIISSVYEHNLCLIFDDNFEIDVDDPDCAYKTNQRQKAINASYKLSKFLWASSYVSCNRNYDLECALADRLYSFYDPKQKLFKNTLSARNGRILATVFAFIGLNKSGQIRPELGEVNKYFSEFLSRNSVITEDNIDDIIFIIWAIAQTIDHADDSLVSMCCSMLSELVNNQNVKHNLIVADKYNIKSAGIRDSFNINKHFIFLQSLEIFIQSKKLSEDYLRTAIVEIINITKCIAKNAVYSRDGKKNNVLFWENYYALQILNDFSAIINDSDRKEDEFMIVSPKLFKGDDYTIDEKLCVVIMPFKTKWSKEIYNTFKEATTGFTIWRSDEEYTDDVIIQTVWEKINRSKFVIADCTGKNPNVFYELGIAHTLGKPVFMCSQNRSDFPFDIHHIRSFEYGMSPGQIRTLKSEIQKFINNL